MVYINCPKCGHKLMEVETGSSLVRIKCGKCGKIIKASVRANEVTIEINEKFSAQESEENISKKFYKNT